MHFDRVGIISLSPLPPLPALFFLCADSVHFSLIIEVAAYYRRRHRGQIYPQINPSTLFRTSLGAKQTRNKLRGELKGENFTSLQCLDYFRSPGAGMDTSISRVLISLTFLRTIGPAARGTFGKRTASRRRRSTSSHTMVGRRSFFAQ